MMHASTGLVRTPRLRAAAIPPLIPARTLVDLLSSIGVNTTISASTSDSVSRSSIA